MGRDHITAPAALASGPSTRASRGPWGGCRCRGIRSPARSRPWPCRSLPRRGRPAAARPCEPSAELARRIGAEHRARLLLRQVAAPQRRPRPREPASADLCPPVRSSGVLGQREPGPPDRLAARSSFSLGRENKPTRVVAPPLDWRFHRGVNPHKPPKSRKSHSLFYFHLSPG